MSEDGFISFPSRWVSEFEAARQVGRSPRTLKRWRDNGKLVVKTRAGASYYEVSQLKRARADALRRYEDRPFTAGAGRGRKHPESDRMADLLRTGVTVAHVASVVGCSTRTVSRVKREMRDPVQCVD